MSLAWATCPYEVDLQQSQWFVDLVIRLHSADPNQIGEEVLQEMVMSASGSSSSFATRASSYSTPINSWFSC